MCFQSSGCNVAVLKWFVFVDGLSMCWIEDKLGKGKLLLEQANEETEKRVYDEKFNFLVDVDEDQYLEWMQAGIWNRNTIVIGMC